ncbi:MAG: hypothetical protein A2V83_07305 [Nitrospirae bacterium RBG_16_64_22]|nr:MAG: hypothetical protein A2V83_07305 [Nitrospirae bacterium RBG_16_64_22]
MFTFSPDKGICVPITEELTQSSHGVGMSLLPVLQSIPRGLSLATEPFPPDETNPTRLIIAERGDAHQCPFIVLRVLRTDRISTVIPRRLT